MDSTLVHFGICFDGFFVILNGLLVKLFDGYILIYNINGLVNFFVEWCIIASGFLSTIKRLLGYEQGYLWNNNLNWIQNTEQV